MLNDNKKASLLALQELQKTLSIKANEKGITEEDLLDELEKVRKKMWIEQK